MLSKEFDFVDALKEGQKHSWTYITKRYNEVFIGNVKPTTLQKRYAREAAYRESIGGSLVDKAVATIKSEPIKPTELARRLDLDLEGLEYLLDDLLNSRSAIKFHNNVLVFDKSHAIPDNKVITVNKGLSEGTWHKIGIVSDTHNCSIHENIELQIAMTNIFEEEGVMAIFNAGDVTAGVGTVYKGQYQELKISGVDKQIQYVTSVYPYSSIPTYMISGNHDLDAFKANGVDVVEKICAGREDLNYVGKLGGFVDIDGIKIYMIHPDGGVPYARTYKMQKIIEGLSGDKKSDIVIFGHWHIMAHLPNYKNTIGIMPGTFETQSDYLIRKGLEPEIGGVILSFMVSDIDGVKHITRHTVEFIDMTPYAK